MSNRLPSAELLAQSAFRTLRVGPGKQPSTQGVAMVLTLAQIRQGLEIAVLMLQVVGVATLVLSRLLPETRLAIGCRVVFVAAMLGLGAAGALCAWYESPFALFAGVTATLFL